MIKDKDIYVYSLRLETKLRELGFKCKRIVPNIKFPNYNVFIHDYSDELVKVIESYNK